MVVDPEPIGEFLAGAAPEVTASELDDWSESTRKLDDLHGVLVATDATVADMTYPEFCDSVLDSGSTSAFTELLEVYPQDGNRSAIYRVTGSRVVDPPRYFRDSPSAMAVIAGRYAPAGIAVALYDEADFEDSTLKYFDSYRLFSQSNRENRSAEIRRGNEIVEAIISTAVSDTNIDIDSKSSSDN